MLAAQKGAVHVDLHGQVPMAKLQVQQRHVDPYARIVNQHVKTAEMVSHFLGQGLDLLLFGHVTLDCDGAAPSLFDLVDGAVDSAGQPASFLLSSGHNNDLGSLLGVGLGYGGSDASAGSRNGGYHPIHAPHLVASSDVRWPCGPASLDGR